MRLYPKKLRSVADLEREKQLLRKESKQLDNEEFLSVDGLMGKSGGGGSLIDMLPISNPIVSQVVKIVAGRLTRKAKAPKAAPRAEYGEEKKDSLLKRGAVEFIGGYLKWKAIELSYKGIRYLIKKRKENREQ